jgi:hypothetical protein
VDTPRNATGPGDCPGFEVDEEKVQVSAAKRIAWWGTQNLSQADLDKKTLEENHTAAQDGLTLATALAQAVGVAQAAIDAVNKAKTEVDTAYQGLGDPTAVGSAGQWPTRSGNTNGNNNSSTGGTTSHGTGEIHGPVGTSNTTSGGPPSTAPSGDVKEWIEQAKKILIEMGYPPDSIDENAIATIIEHESGGNPNAINNWDSNAAAGHPSKGLMQTIDSTFNAYAAPGHTDIWNPVDNIVAATRYSIANYGSLGAVPGVAAVNNHQGYVGY